MTFYVEVDDPATYLACAVNLTFAYMADPEGHIIGLSKGAV